MNKEYQGSGPNPTCTGNAAGDKLLVAGPSEEGKKVVVLDLKNFTFFKTQEMSDYHYEGKLVNDPNSNDIILIGGSANIPIMAEILDESDWSWSPMPNHAAIPREWDYFTWAPAPFVDGEAGVFMFGGRGKFINFMKISTKMSIWKFYPNWKL